MAERLVLAVYDLCDAGSRGLLWKATNGDNTLYLLGTIHVDRSNVYPLHKVPARRRGRLPGGSSSRWTSATPRTWPPHQAMMVYPTALASRTTSAPSCTPTPWRSAPNWHDREEQVTPISPGCSSSPSTTSLPGRHHQRQRHGHRYVPHLRRRQRGQDHPARWRPLSSRAPSSTASDEYQTEGLAAYVATMKSALPARPPDRDDQAKDAVAQQDAVMGAMMEAWKNRDVDAFPTLRLWTRPPS